MRKLLHLPLLFLLFIGYTIQAQPCNITDPGIGSITCDQFGTPSIPGDDFAVVELNPIGTGLGTTYSVTSPEVSASPGFGTYGTISIQDLLGAAQAGPDITLTITDSSDPSCSITFTIPNPAPCPTPPSCNLTNPGLGLAQCNDNGTPGDNSDDFYTFPLDPQGTGLGSGYTVTASNGTLTPPGGTYGGPTTFTLSGVPPGSGVSLIITDNNDPNCTTNTIINPPPCPLPPACNINFSQVGNIVCDDNGTPNDPADDTFTFIITVTGTGTGNGWTTNDPLNTTGAYDVVTTMGPYPISIGSINLIATDNNDPNCSTIAVVVVAPPPCSSGPSCNLSNSGLGNISCVDNGTPGDPSDDFVQFTLNPTGTGLGTNYSVSITPGNITPIQGNYGASNSFITDPGSGGLGDFTITITDQSDPNCSLTFTLVNPCTNTCTISAVASSPVCNDNGTPSNPADDTFTFDVTVSGSGTGSNWSANDPNGTTGSYDTPTTFGPYLISDGTLFLTITDGNDPNCITTLTVTPPPPCSNACNLQSANLGNSFCVANGTPNDPFDDFIEFTLNPSGLNLGAGYTVVASSGTISPGNGTYGSPTVFQTSPGTAGNGPIILTITDDADPNCTITVTLPDPGVCSILCDILLTLENTECFDNGTPTDPGDDLFVATVLLNGTGSGWTADDPAASTGPFGASVTLGPYPISGGPVVVTFTSLDDPTCQEFISIDPPSTCSDQCLIQPAVVGGPTCDANGTPTDPGDDIFTVEVLVNGTGITWSADDPVGSTGVYGTIETFGPFLIANGTVFITFTDDDDPTCQEVLAVDPPPTCSDDCVIAAAINDVICDDNGTPANSDDDTFTAILNVSGINASSNWVAGPPGNTGGAYGVPVVVGPFSTLQSPVTFTVSDQADPNCITQVVINSPGGCSAGCTTTDSTFLSQTSCNPLDTGIMIETLSNIIGCDSLVITTTTLLPSDTTQLIAESCNPQDTGVVETLLTNQFGCDSLVITTTTLLPRDTTLIQQSSCNPQDTGVVETLLNNQFGCDSLVITNTAFQISDTTQMFLESCNPQDTGVVETLLTNQFGCDSLVVTTTTLLPSDTTQLFTESCNPQDTGVVETLLSNQFGCDSLVVTTTTLLPSDTTQLLLESCNPQDTGVVETLLTNQFGCDSLVVATTTLLPSDTTQLLLESCNPQDTGVVETLLTNQFGCDSLVITNTAFQISDTTQLFLESCNPQDTGVLETLLTNQFGCDSLVITNTAFQISDTTQLFLESCNPQDTGVVEALLTNKFGCDSLVVTTTTLLPSDTTQLFLESCNPQDTGVVEALLTNKFGCDSLVVTTTTLLPSDTTQLLLESCNPQDTGVVETLLTNQFGCDSLVVSTTTLLPSDTTQLLLESCNPQDTGVVETLLTNQFGCDSLVVATTTLLPSDTTQMFLESCNPQDTGVVETLLTNQFGCDSLVVTTTMLLPSDTTQLLLESCNPQDTGVVETLLTNQFGCDSLVVTTTTLLPSDTTQMFLESCNPQDTGVVETLLSNQFGCDSLVVTTTTLLPSDTTQMFLESCNPQDTGVVETLLTNQFDCDSLVVTTTTLLPSDTTQLLLESCNPQDTGVVETLLSNQFGCDSLVVTTTTLLPSDTTQLLLESCNPQDTGVVETLLSNQFGCDSLVVTTTTLLPSDTTQLLLESCNPQDTGVVETLLSNQFGCDSLVVTTTTLLASDTTQLLLESCNPQDTGVVETLLTNQFGCDSLVVTTTTLLASDTTQLLLESCNPKDTGVVETLLTNQFGCDSLIITTTTLLSSPSSILTPEICFGDSILINGTLYNIENSSGIDTFVASNGCDSLVFIDLEILPPAQFRQIDTLLCAGEQLTINGQIYNENRPNGTQIITGVNGCDSLQIEINITYNDLQFEASAEQPFCAGLPGHIQLLSVSGGMQPIRYRLDGQNFRELDSVPLILEGIFPGTYILQIDDSLGCQSQRSLTVIEGLETTVDLGVDLTIELGESIILKPSINFPYDSLIWTPEEAVSCQGCLNPSVIATESVRISLLAFDLQGCEAEDEVYITLDRRVSVYIPNVFSPNDDGSNDYFTLYADDNQVVRIRRLAIFDRWGNQVFERENFSPGVVTQGWDGRYRGKEMNPAVFVYYAEVELIDGRTELFKGDVTLIK